MNDWCFNIDRGMVNGILFLDQKEAFDTVDRKILEFYGFKGITLYWFLSYLADRHQACCVNGVISSTKTIFCGVPQGSILGPLLFLIYVNDTAISINIVGLKLKAFESRPNGGMGIYWNLHISVEEIYKFVFLHMEYLFFLQ